jgi:alginate O-acetyltransferase complex protein AlgI
MLFGSPIFVFAFLPLVYLLNLKMPVKISNVFLTMASLLFYAWGEPVYILLLIASVTVNYYAALLIARSNKYKKTIFIISLIFNIGLLVIFKYTGFLLGTITGLMQLNYEVPAIALPLGISFFTFQIMSYVIDVYMGRVEVQRSYLKLMLYISFFPQNKNK